MMRGFIHARNCSSLSGKVAIGKEEERTGLTLRALAVKGALALLGFKIGTAMYSPIGAELDWKHLRMTKQSLQAAESNLQKTLKDMKEYRDSALLKKEERV